MKKYLVLFTLFSSFVGLNLSIPIEAKAETINKISLPSSLKEVYHNNLNPDNSLFYAANARKGTKITTKTQIIPIYKTSNTRATLHVGNVFLRYFTQNGGRRINQELTASATYPIHLQGNFFIDGKIVKGVREIDTVGFSAFANTPVSRGYHATCFKGMMISAVPNIDLSDDDINLFEAIIIR